MVYMLSVLTCAIFASRQIWGAIASVLSILVFNFFFTEPFRTLQVNDPGYLITLGVRFITAVISSTLTRKVKDYARSNARKAYRTEILLETSRTVSYTHLDVYKRQALWWGGRRNIWARRSSLLK